MFTRTTKNADFEVPFNKSQRRLRLLYAAIKYNGLGDTAGLILDQITRKMGRGGSASRKLGQSRCVVSGLDVDGIIAAETLGADASYGANRYEATPDLEFRDVLDGLNLDHAQFDFLDYGSGKGAALAVAARYPFRTVIGVEFAHDLHDVAHANLDQLAASGKINAGHVEAICKDAAKYQPPARPHVYFFYNPFQAEVTKTVIDICCAAARGLDQASYIIFKNPVQAPSFEGNPQIVKLSEPYGGSWRVYRIDPA